MKDANVSGMFSYCNNLSNINWNNSLFDNCDFEMIEFNVSNDFNGLNMI